MIASELITEDYPVLSPDDKLHKAIDIFLDSSYCHLPVVEDGKLRGLLAVDLILTIPDREKMVSDFEEDWLQAFAYDNQHGQEIFQIIARQEITALPVVGEDKTYLGTIHIQDLLFRLSNIFSFRQMGGIIVLSMGMRDYDLSEISRIVETNNSRILMLYFDQDELKEQLTLTIKVDTIKLDHILATLERFKYTVEFHYPSIPQTDELKERYQLLMKLFDL